MQDETGGVFFESHQVVRLPPAGHAVTVRGRTEPGNFAPILRAYEVIDHGWRPALHAPEFPIDELLSGHHDSQWVSLRGQLRRTGWDGETIRIVDMVSGHRRLRIDLPVGTDARALSALWGSDVIVTGVCGAIFNRRRQILGIRLMVPSLDHVKVIQRPTRAPFELPRRPIAQS